MMKNFTEHDTSRAPCAGQETSERERLHKRRLRLARKQDKINWLHDNSAEYQSDFLKRLTLGRLPRRAAKAACAAFDLSDIREYCGPDEIAVSGEKLAGIAAHIVRCAKDPVTYLSALRDVPAKLIEPIKTYLRVKLAMGRLEAEIEKTKINLSSRTSGARSGTSQEQEHGEETAPLNPNDLEPDSWSYEVPGLVVCKQTNARDDRGDRGNDRPVHIPKFKWHTSPAKIHDIKNLTETCGYDPRGTSVYWIERRAAALRRKWKNHGRKLRGEVRPARRKRNELITSDASAEPIIKHYVPPDIDYNSVWPPVEMPDGPPKLEDNKSVIPEFAPQISGTSQEQVSDEVKEPLNADFSSTASCASEVPDQVRDDRFFSAPYKIAL